MFAKKDSSSLTPEFPKKAFLLFLFILQEDKVLSTIPMESIYTTPRNAAKAVLELIQNLRYSDTTITIPEESLLLPLNYRSVVKLKKGYLNEPKFSYDSQNRLNMFNKVLNYPGLYSLLVTPFSYDDNLNKWHFNATLPILSHIKRTRVEGFMHKSNQKVEPRAKYAAIYQIEKKLRFNWQTCKIKEFDSSAKRLFNLAN